MKLPGLTTHCRAMSDYGPHKRLVVIAHPLMPWRGAVAVRGCAGFNAVMSDHCHGHHHDRGVKATLRYLRHAPRMWRSEINTAVIELVAPRPGERVVDIGAGMCPGSVLAARHGAEVVAVEPTPFMRLVSRIRRLGQRARRRITVVDGAAERVPMGDATVDALWAVNTMHHWMDADRAIAEMARILRPGGRVVLVDEDFDDPAHPDHERFGGRHGNLEDHGFHKVDAQPMGQRLIDAGLVGVDTSRTDLAGRPVVAVTATAPQ
jgi:SAM-dependent methyltransferase